MMTMDYYIYHLKFDTPVHFGAAEQGGKLEQIDMRYPSDTLFSALCCELAAGNQQEGIREWTEKAECGQIILSDLMPFASNRKETCYYLPKPVLLIEQEDTVKVENLEDVRKQATVRKKQKKLTYIRASRMEEYIDAMKCGSSFTEPIDFGTGTLAAQVWQRRDEDPLPYYVGKFFFHDDAGMYFIAGLQMHEDADWLYGILQSLGLTGIGGKRSSGCGKFHVAEEPKIISACNAADLKALSKLLSDDRSTWQMCISSLIPDEADVSVVKESQYRLMKRSGFTTLLEGGVERKKNSVYALGSGSCFPARLNGCIVSLGQESDHEIYRMGKSIYVGLPI